MGEGLDLKRLQVCFAAYSGQPPVKAVRLAERLVEQLVSRCRDRRLVGFLGGYRGLMKIIVDKLMEKGVDVVLVLPRDYEGIDEPEGAVIVKTGMDSKGRSIILVRSCDVLVVVGGASGTLMEAVAAYGIGIPVVYLVGSGLPTDALRNAYPEGVLDDRLGRGIWYVETPEEAAELVCSFAEKGPQ